MLADKGMSLSVTSLRRSSYLVNIQVIPSWRHHLKKPAKVIHLRGTSYWVWDSSWDENPSEELTKSQKWLVESEELPPVPKTSIGPGYSLMPKPHVSGSMTLVEGTIYFENKFHTLVNKTYLEVKENMNPLVFLSCITCLLVLARTHHRSFIKELTNIPPPVTFEKIWLTLNLYWDFLNYEQLEHAIKKCGRPSTQSQEGSFHDGEGMVPVCITRFEVIQQESCSQVLPAWFDIQLICRVLRSRRQGWGGLSLQVAETVHTVKTLGLL